jgi:hypothetical protein
MAAYLSCVGGIRLGGVIPASEVIAGRPACGTGETSAGWNILNQQ